MATVTAQQLIAAGLGRADEIDAADAFIPHPTSAGSGFDAFTLLNAAISELYDILYESDESAFGFTILQQSLQVGLDRYALNTDLGDATFYRLKAIDVQLGGRWSPVTETDFSKRNNYQGGNGLPRFYYLAGAYVYMLPTPDQAYPVRTAWIPNPPTLSNNSDTIDLQGPWREFVEVHFEIAAKIKAQLDCTEARQRLYGPGLDGNGGLCARVRGGARRRASMDPSRPIDVMGDDSAYAGSGGILGPFDPWRPF